MASFLFLNFLAELGLCCCKWAFSCWGEQGLLSSCGKLGLLPVVAVLRLLTVVASLVAEPGHASLWAVGLVALWHVGSSWIRETHVPCIGRWILNHCSTREVLYCGFWTQNLYHLSGWIYSLSAGMEAVTSFNLHMHQRKCPLNKNMTLGKSSHIFQLSYLSKRDNTPAYLKNFIKAKYMKW